MTSRRTLKVAVGVALWLPAVFLACNGPDDKDTGTAPPEDELVIENLGSATLSDTGGYIDVDVTIPDGTVSTMAWCGGWGDQGLGAIWSLTNPGGTQVFSGEAPDAGGFRSDFLDDLTPALLPVSPTVAPTPGTWNFQWFVGANNDGTADCGAVHRVDTLSDPATIFINFVFVGVTGIDASSAPDDPAWQQVLTQLEAEWGSGRLSPTYAYENFTGDVTRFSVVDISDDDLSEFNALLRTSSPASPRTLTLFMVQEISNSSAGGASVLGLSAGPPGAAAVHGMSKSGVVVTTADLASAPGDVAKIIAHEGGHFLGLFHTTEKDGARFDPLADTPQCAISNDTNANGIVNSDECVGSGSDNVMWWTLTGGTATMTGNQSLIVRSNPIAD